MAEQHQEPLVDQSLTINEDPESAKALDAALDEFGGDTVAQTTPVEETAPKAEESTTPAVQTDDSLPAEQPEAEPAAAKETDATRLPVEGADKAVPAVEEDPDIKALDTVKLRADASQKTKDTFANLKQMSASAIRAAKAEAARLKAEQEKAVEEARKAAIEEAKKQAAVPEDVQKELEELRRLRARVDVESDPKFKEQFDAKRDANYEEVYGILSQYGLKESEVKVLRSLPEADRLGNITDMAAKLPPASKLKIEAKLFDNLNISDARDRALKDAREQAQKLHAEREGQTKAQQEALAKEREEAVSGFKTHSVFKRADIPANTPAEERKRLEGLNQQVEKFEKLFGEIVADESPKAKVEAAFGVVLAHKFKADLDAANAKLAAAQKELDAIKKRSGVTDKGRLVNTPANQSGARPSTIESDPGSALDELAKEFGAQ